MKNTEEKKKNIIPQEIRDNIENSDLSNEEKLKVITELENKKEIKKDVKSNETVDKKNDKSKEQNESNIKEKVNHKKDLKEVAPYKLVWGVIAIGIACLLIYNTSDPNIETWNQTKLLENLENGRVTSIRMTPINSTMLSIEGDYLLIPDKTTFIKTIANSNENNVENEIVEEREESEEGDNKETAEKKEKGPLTKKFTCNVLDSEILKALIIQSRVTAKAINGDTFIKSLVLNFLPILLLILIIYLIFSRQIKQASRGAMGFGQSKAKIINPDDHKTRFNDVAGAEEAKEEIVEIVEYLKDPLKFKLLGAKIPKGALLTGPPGTGKTLMAKAVAGEAGVPFYLISGSDFVEMFVGVGASRVRDMFEQARAVAPCLIFIDEIDAVGRSRFSGVGGGNDEREQTLNAMLVEMDGLESQEGVIVLAATNRPDVLDPALLRPGRFDRQIVMDLPDIKGRKQILNVHIKNIKVEKGIDLDKIARGTAGFSGADLANLINEAGLLAARFKREAANISDLEEARDKVRWGRERKSRRITDKEKEITAYHEAGHALVGLYTESTEDDLHKVTIIPRGNAYLGATMYLPNDDKYTQSRNELKDRMAMTMGGRVAEEIIFDDITSGAAGDIESATHIAKMMICYYGMSDILGPMQLGEAKEQINRSGGIVKTQSYSEETAQLIDTEIKKMLNEAKARATNILTEHKDQLELLSQELLEKETLEAADIKILLNL